MNQLQNQPENQPEKRHSDFSFNSTNIKIARDILKRYPETRRQSSLVPLLDLAQRQNGGWLSRQAIEYVANFLGLHYMQVYAVVSFYSMFNLKPVGKYHIQICTTTPCWLKESDKVKAAFEQELGIKLGQITEDQLFSLAEVECLGACTNAPVVQINDDYHENLDEQKITELIKQLKKLP